MTGLITAGQQVLNYWEQVAWGDAVMADKMNTLRAALAEPVQEPVAAKSVHDKVYSEVELSDAYQQGWNHAMRRRSLGPHIALADTEEDPALSAALGWVGGISEPVLDRKALLRRVAEIAQDMQAKTKRAWDVGYDSGLKAAPERRLTDAEIGEVWFAAKIPGLTETQARLLIRAAERRLLEGKQ